MSANKFQNHTYAFVHNNVTNLLSPATAPFLCCSELQIQKPQKLDNMVQYNSENNVGKQPNNNSRAPFIQQTAALKMSINAFKI